MKKKKRAASPGLGCLFWAALVVVLVAVALAVREPVVRNVRQLLGRGDEAPTSGEPATSEDAPSDSAATSPQATPPAATTPAATTPAATSPQATPPAATTPAATTPAATTPAATTPAATTPVRTRTARVWFATVDESGRVELAPAQRSLPAGDSPLRDNLAALLAGPTSVERADGLVSFVPPGTVVRSVTVKGDTAFIDFSEQFRFNALGIDGLRAQLRQVVWAATEFPTVRRVQLLIEGERVEYLGPEGAAVGSPLGRDSSFQ